MLCFVPLCHFVCQSLVSQISLVPGGIYLTPPINRRHSSLRVACSRETHLLMYLFGLGSYGLGDKFWACRLRMYEVAKSQFWESTGTFCRRNQGTPSPLIGIRLRSGPSEDCLHCFCRHTWRYVLNRASVTLIRQLQPPTASYVSTCKGSTTPRSAAIGICELACRAFNAFLLLWAAMDVQF